MASGMSDYQSKSTDIGKDYEKGLEGVNKIGDEFKGVKDGLMDMPTGLDSDLQQMIKNVETSGRAEALADIEAVKKSIIDKAKADADKLQSDVNAKIADNNTARGKLDSLTSKYGKDSASQAKAAIDTNTQKGESVLQFLNDALKETESSVQDTIDKL